MDIEYIEKNTNLKVEYHSNISSTSERAREIAEESIKKSENDLEKIQIVISENQTNGKGTHGRVWHSEKGKNILMTLIFYPKNSPQELQGITYLIAREIQSVIYDLYNISLDIKLPNDLMLNGKKVCGILTESSIQNEKVNYLLVGIGFNVNQEKFSNELEGVATSLKNEFTDIELNIEEITIMIINRVKSLII